MAAALGVEPTALAGEVRSWVDGQLRHGLIDTDRHAQVLGLLGEAGTEGGEPR